MTNKNKSHNVVGKVKKNKNSFVSAIKSLDWLSWFFIIILITVSVYMASFLFALNKAVEEEGVVGDAYYDELLNFNLTIPHNWQGAKPDEAHVKEVVREITGGILFDMKLHSLTDELVPLALIVPPEVGSKDPFAKFMTLAFRGTDDEFAYLQDKVKLMDDFKSLLKSMEHTDIKVKEIKDIKNEELFGIMLEGSAKLKDQTIYYTQYLEPAGANIMIVTYGSTIKDEGVKDITTILSTLIFNEGGEFLPTPLQEEMIEATKKQDALDAKNAETGTGATTPTTPITPWGAPTSKDAVPGTSAPTTPVTPITPWGAPTSKDAVPSTEKDKK
jgi:hypothetical protein